MGLGRNEYRNAEAGFTVDWKGASPLLKLLPENQSILFADNLEKLFSNDDDLEQNYPQLALQFDWMNDELSAIAIKPRNMMIKLIGMGGAGKPLIRNWEISNKKNIYTGKTEQLKIHLKNSSMVTVSVLN